MPSTDIDEEERAILRWFKENGFRVQLEIGAKNVSDDPQAPDFRPDHEEKYARVDRVIPGAAPQFFRKYKMDPSDTTFDSHMRVKQLLESENLRATEDTQKALNEHVIPKLQKCACPVCKSIDWRISESIFEIQGFFGRLGPSQVVPVVLATCHICGHILPFNAIHVGAVKQESESKP